MDKKILFSIMTLLVITSFAFVANAQTITTISPQSANVGSEPITLTINGSGFVSGSTVSFNWLTKSNTYISSTQLKADIPALDLATEGTYMVTVYNPGGAASNDVAFRVLTPGLPSTGFGPDDEQESVKNILALVGIIASASLLFVVAAKSWMVVKPVK